MNATARRRLWFGLSTGGLALVVAAAVFRMSAPRPSPTNSRSLSWKQVSEIHLERGLPESVAGQWEGIEPAERINWQIMRRYQEHWNRFEKPQAPFRPALPGITEGDK